MASVSVFSRRGKNEKGRFREYLCSDGVMFRSQEQPDGTWLLLRIRRSGVVCRVVWRGRGSYGVSYGAWFLAIRHEKSLGLECLTGVRDGCHIDRLEDRPFASLKCLRLKLRAKGKK